MLQLGTVLLPDDVDVAAMKDWLYDQRGIEVVVHRWNNAPILRFSVHLHTSENDLQRLVASVREYLAAITS